MSRSNTSPSWWRRWLSGRLRGITRTSAIEGRGSDESSQQKLARLCRWSVTGRRAAAELELYEWQRDRQCPADAAVLYAALTAGSQRMPQALAALERFRTGRGAMDPVVQQTVATLYAAAADPRATTILSQLHREHGHEPAVGQWLATIAAPMSRSLPAVSHATIEQLAGELLDHLDVIPSLVAAQRIERSASTISMLRGAITQMLRDLTDERAMLTACQALADLALLAGDHDDARRWAHRGLRIDPYAAQLAMILSRVKDDISVGPPASTVLQGAVNAHPRYPDLRAALIRREFAEGRIEVARRRLQQWLQREPNQPLAIRLQTELAA